MKIKYYITMALFVGFLISAQAQSSGIDRYYEKYKDDDRFSQITVSSKMFGLFVNFEMDDPAEQELVETISKLEGLKMLVGSDIDEAKSIFEQVVQKPRSNMDELMSIRDKEAEFMFFITESDGTISELLMVGYDDAEVMLLSLVGEIDLKQISALSQKMNIQGFEHFKNIDK